MSFNKTLLSHLLDDELKMVAIKFGSHGKSYNYKTNLDLSVGDTVLVPCPSTSTDLEFEDSNGDKMGMAVVQVVAVDIEPDFDSSLSYKWVIGKVDLETYNELVVKDKELQTQVKDIEKQVRRKALQSALFEYLGDTKSQLLSNTSFKKETAE